MYAYRTAFALAALAVAAPLSAQIIVGDPDEERKRPRYDYAICSASLRDGRTAWSGRIFIDVRHSHENGVDDAFEAYLTSRFGRVRDAGCHTDNQPWVTLPQSDERNIYTGWTGGYPTERPARQTQPSPPSPEPKPASQQPIATQLAPEQRLARERAEDEAYQRALAEHQRQVQAAADAQRQFEEQKVRQREAAQAVDQDYQRRLADAQAAQQRYREELAQHQRLVQALETQADRNAKVDWKEAVTVCGFHADDGQSKFGNWRCEGALQMTYAKLGTEGLSAPTGGALTAISEACGSRRESIRDLGMVGGYRVFGCGWGLHPDSGRNSLYRDQAPRFGLTYIPGRNTYRCPRWKSSCRTS